MTEKMSTIVPELTLTLATALASSLAFKATENPTASNIGTSECESPTAMQVDKSMSRRRQCSTTKSRLSYLLKYRATLPVKRPSGPSSISVPDTAAKPYHCWKHSAANRQVTVQSKESIPADRSRARVAWIRLLTLYSH